jgi:hypothetical protein
MRGQTLKIEFVTPIFISEKLIVISNNERPNSGLILITCLVVLSVSLKYFCVNLYIKANQLNHVRI